MNLRQSMPSEWKPTLLNSLKALQTIPEVGLIQDGPEALQRAVDLIEALAAYATHEEGCDVGSYQWLQAQDELLNMLILDARVFTNPREDV
jgi:hypothetical protein